MKMTKYQIKLIICCCFLFIIIISMTITGTIIGGQYAFAMGMIAIGIMIAFVWLIITVLLCEKGE